MKKHLYLSQKSLHIAVMQFLYETVCTDDCHVHWRQPVAIVVVTWAVESDLATLVITLATSELCDLGQAP